MAFEDLDGQVLTDHQGVTYIIADSFSVFYPGGEDPLVYSWNDVRALYVGTSSMTINTNDNEYVIASGFFGTREQFLRAKAIAVSNATLAGAYINSPVSILPKKRFYENCDIPVTACIESGEYNIKDIKHSMLFVVVNKIIGILWISGIFGGLAGIWLLHMLVGFNESNWWYLLIGGLFIGIGTVSIVYLTFVLITRIAYSAELNSYIKEPDEITFAVCDHGFSVCESCIYNPYGLIRWNIKDNYVETSTMFIIVRSGKAIAWIPKSLFTREQQDEIASILAVNLSEK